MCDFIFLYMMTLSFWFCIAPCCVEILAPMIRAYMSKDQCLRSLGATFISLFGSALYYTLGGCFYASFLALGSFIYYSPMMLPTENMLRKFLFWNRNEHVLDGNGGVRVSNTCPSDPEQDGCRMVGDFWMLDACCVNGWELVQDVGTCDKLLSQGFTCESDFCPSLPSCDYSYQYCPSCTYARYCDKSCGYGYCSEYWQTVLDPTDGATPTASQVPASVLPLKPWEFVPLNAAGNNRDQ